ncbi:MAG TPA: FtsQ-type POTRA domain-containing protein [Rubricoccaceae bacterium]|nr:FtsQ-type POTRA domain-containing protein [Rubricoccaceae bacterium]
MATTKHDRLRQRLRRLALGAGVLVVGALVALAWRWQDTLPLRRVTVEGNRHAQAEELVRLAHLHVAREGVEDDSTADRLFALQPLLVADRMARHPWVRSATVRRYPTGTLAVRVVEREPAALVLTADGRPSHYLDGEGYAMPLARGAAYDVPLLRGRLPAYHPRRPVRDRALRDLLAALAEVRASDPAADALVSEITWGAGGATLLTPPVEGRGSLPVRLGRGDASDKLRRLRAFWAQAVLPRPQTPIRLVDLRFDGQVVTQGEPTAQRLAFATDTTADAAHDASDTTEDEPRDPSTEAPSPNPSPLSP